MINLTVRYSPSITRQAVVGLCRALKENAGVDVTNQILLSYDAASEVPFSQAAPARVSAIEIRDIADQSAAAFTLGEVIDVSPDGAVHSAQFRRIKTRRPAE